MTTVIEQHFTLSLHAVRRLRERFNLRGEEALRVVKRALEEGFWTSTWKQKRGKPTVPRVSTVYYGDMAVIYHEKTGTVLTVRPKTRW